MRKTMNLASAACVACALAAAPAGAQTLSTWKQVWAQNPGQLTAAWWQWAWSLHGGTKQNPVQDRTGALCMVGQTGSVWFLAGDFGGVSNRTCSVPSDRALLVPLLNQAWFSSPGLCGNGDAPYTVPEMRKILNESMKNAAGLVLVLDGHDMMSQVRRVKTAAPYSLAFADDNWTANIGIACPGGVYYPVIDDGFWALLPPQTAGQHTLRLAAQTTGFWLDVTYTLNVVATKGPR